MRASTAARATLLTAALALALAAACGGDDDDTAGRPGNDTTTTTMITPTEADATTSSAQAGSAGDSIELGNECSFEEAGKQFTVRYPTEWVTNDETEGQVGTVPACRIFDPDDAEPPRATELTAFGVILNVDQVPFSEVEQVDPSNAEVFEERSLTVSGREAVQREVRLTEDGISGPADARVTTYVVDLDGAILVARTHEVADLHYGRNTEVLSAMMQELSIDEAD